jgi:putative ABC transport system permease protein
LHLDGVGAIYNITDSHGQRVPLRVVGLLQNSLFQGDLLMRENDLVRLFPETSGYRVFLVDTKQNPPAEFARVLDSALGDYGFDAEPSRRRLESFMAVQNTYLSTFQRLGGLGLLLGTIGLAVVQLRSVLERRGELALMRAVGFRRRRLAGMVLLENAALLVGGLAIGVIAALVAIMPQLFSGRATTPWLSLAGTLGIVLAFGLTAGLLAVRATLRAPLVPALRDE